MIFWLGVSVNGETEFPREGGGDRAEVIRMHEKLERPVVTATERPTPSALDVPRDSVCACDSVSATELVVDANELLEWDCVTVWCAGV